MTSEMSDDVATSPAGEEIFILITRRRGSPCKRPILSYFDKANGLIWQTDSRQDLTFNKYL